MSTCSKRIVGILSALLLCYGAAYFLSVTTSYLATKAVDVAVPTYRPWDADIVHAIFAPVQAFDASYLRPSRWREKIRT
jgi:hypothetical protein